MYAKQTAMPLRSGCYCAEQRMQTVPVTPVMAYVPAQNGIDRYPELLALENGTLFPTLNKPLMQKGGCCCDRKR